MIRCGVVMLIGGVAVVEQMAAWETAPARVTWTEEEKELAFQVWSFQAGKNVSQTARILETQYALSIGRRTIQDWQDKYQWSLRRAELIRQLAPDLEQHVSLELKLGSRDAVQFLRNVVQGDADTLAAYGKQLAAAVQAARGLLEYGGWHVRAGERLTLHTTATPQDIDLTTATDEELADIELRMLE